LTLKVNFSKSWGKTIVVGGEPACFLKALYQSGPASDFAVARYLGFIAAQPLVITYRTLRNPGYPAIFYGGFIGLY
jgi:hypothetical protein